MIYFTQNTLTKNIKIGYSGKPKKRVAGLRSHVEEGDLVLLGTIQGGLEHEFALHERFAPFRTRGEWFRGEILGDVLALLAQEAAANRPLHTNVIIAGDCDPFFAYSSDPLMNARKAALEAIVPQALGEIHAKTPVAWIISGGERFIEMFALAWARKNNVQIQQYFPNWKKHGRSAAFQLAPKLLRTMFDPKLLLVFLAGTYTKNTSSLISKAEKAAIEVVVKRL